MNVYEKLKSKRFNFLVTGGAGFIGSNIVDKLLEYKQKVIVLDNFSTGKRENIVKFLKNPDFKLIRGSTEDAKLCYQICKGIDFVLHQAALPSVPRSIKDPLATNNANITGTLNMLMAAKETNVKRFIYASSSSIYGTTPKLPKTEEMAPSPVSPYALSKYAGERYCQIFNNIYGIKTISLRYFNVFGERQDPNSQYAAVIPKFIKAILENKSSVIYGNGKQTRDFTYVGNVVQANILACFSKRACGSVFNIACGQQTSINELYKKICKILNKRVDPVYDAERVGDVRHSLADISKAKKILGYFPEYTLERGLKKLLKRN